jgi:hypothetical protein
MNGGSAKAGSSSLIVRHSSFPLAVLLVLVSLALIAGCWKAGFTNYDDTAHITGNPHLAMPATDLLKPTADST